MKKVDVASCIQLSRATVNGGTTGDWVVVFLRLTRVAARGKFSSFGTVTDAAAAASSGCGWVVETPSSDCSEKSNYGVENAIICIQKLQYLLINVFARLIVRFNYLRKVQYQEMFFLKSYFEKKILRLPNRLVCLWGRMLQDFWNCSRSATSFGPLVRIGKGT